MFFTLSELLFLHPLTLVPDKLHIILTMIYLTLCSFNSSITPTLTYALSISFHNYLRIFPCINLLNLFNYILHFNNEESFS